MELLERIGSGAYGEVWLARNAATGARRAVKIVYRATFADERPFHREFEGIKKFESISHSHPSQLSLFQVGRNDEAGYFYYVMELGDSVANSASYQARTLRSELAQGRLPAARALEIALALTEALAHLHAHGLVHRDVKPSNIIFVQGRPKLADIGLVTDASDNRSIVGTEGYLPLEGPGTPAADIFALGKVLYEAVTGQDRRQFPNLPAELRDWSDAILVFELNEILLKACAADARERYSSADSMLADLKLLDAGKSVKRRRSFQQGLSWSWKAVVLFGLLWLAFFLIRNEQRRAVLTQRDPRSFENSGTTNFMAWQATQRALQMVTFYNVQTMSNAIQEAEKAITLDPNYADAWSSIAIILSLSADYGFLPARNVLPRAKLSAEKAISLNSRGGFAYTTLAECNLAIDYDFAGAERLYRKALAIQPGNLSAKSNFARILNYYGHFSEAEALLNQIADSDPTYSPAYRHLAILLAATGRFQESISKFEVCDRLLPNRPHLHLNRADVFAGMGDRLSSAKDLLRFVELNGFSSLDAQSDGAALRKVLTEDGPEEFLRRHIDLLEDRSKNGHFVSAYDLARLHLHAGNLPKALDYLDQAIAEHRLMVLSIEINPLFKKLHNEPRFQAALRVLRLDK